MITEFDAENVKIKGLIVKENGLILPSIDLNGLRAERVFL